MAFKDHFSGHAAQYARARPGYPVALFEFLAAHCPSRRAAWDCACGNGQASKALKELFDTVIGTDGSMQQLSQAISEPGLLYCQAEAEAQILATHSIDLVCVAQALHWFELERFYVNVREVLRPGGLIAIWCYGLHRINEPVDAVIAEFYDGVVGPYWPDERTIVERGYGNLPFPFEEIDVPVFEMTCDWTVDELLAYLSSWSAVRRYLKALGRDPIEALAPELRRAWGEADRRTVSWPLDLRLGRSRPSMVIGDD